jgi:oligosaccharide repeat unit polymerase
MLTRLAFTGTLAALLVFRDQLLALPLNGMSQVAAVISITALVAVARLATRGLYSGGFLYLLTLALFHLGLSFLTAFGLPFAPKYQTYNDLWFRPDGYATEAVYLSMLAVVAFTAVYAWSTVRFRAKDPKPRPDRTQPDPIWLGRIGALLVIAGSALFLGYIAIVAPQVLLGGSYSSFDEFAGGAGPVTAGVEIVAMGAILTAAAPKTRARRVALVALAIFGVLALGMGSRTAIMYGALAAVVVAARVHRMPRARVALLGIVLAVVAVGLVAQLRDVNTGTNTTTSTAVNFSPVPALSEMGGSLRPVVETLDWRLGWHEPPYNGLTYAAGPLRIYERVMGIPRPDPDPRFASTLTSERVKGYNIGYSAVAEAFLNFGTPGVVVFFALVGLLLGKADNTWADNHFAAAQVGVVVYALSYEVRQASNIVLTLIVAGMVIVAVTRLVARPHKRRFPVVSAQSRVESRRY